jgi:hypothetical protein
VAESVFRFFSAEFLKPPLRDSPEVKSSSWDKTTGPVAPASLGRQSDSRSQSRFNRGITEMIKACWRSRSMVQKWRMAWLPLRKSYDCKPPMCFHFVITELGNAKPGFRPVINSSDEMK